MKKVLTVLFCILYIAVAFVSTYHAISFFSLSNVSWLAAILSIAFEIGQAAVLFYLLISRDKKLMAWGLMIVLTLVQILGNVYSSYKYMIINNSDLIKYFTDSILFFMQDPNPKVNQVMISYITGAILPVVSLCMTSMIVSVSGAKVTEPVVEKPVEKQIEEIIEPAENPVEEIVKTVEKPIEKPIEEPSAEPTKKVTPKIFY